MCHDSRVRGCLYAIGLGPGDPDLLTVRAVKILKEADRIIVPKAIDKPSTARDIVSRALGEELPFQEMVFPMSRSLAKLREQWEENARAVLSFLEEGEKVAFVTLGDVSLYSTFSYLEQELKKMASAICIERIPGISSVQLAAVRFETDLALGTGSYAVVPLPLSLDDLKGYLELHETLVILKVGKRLHELVDWLEKERLIEKASFIRRAGFPDERLCYSLKDLGEEESGYLSIVMIKRN